MTGNLPIVLVPGLNCSARLYAPQIPELWRFGPVTVADHTRDDTMAAIATRILDAAPPRFHYVGLSMGGYIAFEIMRQAPRARREARAARHERARRSCGDHGAAHPADRARRDRALRGGDRDDLGAAGASHVPHRRDAQGDPRRDVPRCRAGGLRTPAEGVPLARRTRAPRSPRSAVRRWCCAARRTSRRRRISPTRSRPAFRARGSSRCRSAATSRRSSGPRR